MTNKMIDLSKSSYNPVMIKICGIRSDMAARTAIYAGAKFLGFNFVPGSKRRVSPEIAKQIIDQFKAQVKIVGVFQNQDIEEVKEIAETLDLDYVQLHGEEDPAYAQEIGRPIIKVLQLESEFDITQVLKEMNKFKTDLFLLDRKKQGKGKLLDPKHLSIIAKEKQIFVAGGLTPENVAEVVRLVRPFGVDVAGGIETNRIEDTEKIKSFIERAKGGARG
jgi:phosphoribosylanthranilate isomerase